MTYLVIQYGANVVAANVFGEDGLLVWTSDILDPMFNDKAAEEVEQQAIEYIAAAQLASVGA